MALCRHCHTPTPLDDMAYGSTCVSCFGRRAGLVAAATERPYIQHAVANVLAGLPLWLFPEEYAEDHPDGWDDPMYDAPYDTQGDWF